MASAFSGLQPAMDPPVLGKKIQPYTLCHIACHVAQYGPHWNCIGAVAKSGDERVRAKAKATMRVADRPGVRKTIRMMGNAPGIGGRGGAENRI